MRTLIFVLFFVSSALAQTTRTFVGKPYIEDVKTRDYMARNYGASSLEIGEYSTRFKIFMRLINVNDSIPAGSVVTSAVCSLYCYAVYGDTVTVHAYRVWKNGWVEGTGTGGTTPTDSIGLCQSHWKGDASTADSSWGTSGAERAVDTCCCNRGNGIGADRAATAFAEIKPIVAGWNTITIPNSLMQGWISGDSCNGGFVIRPDNTTGSGLDYFSNTEGSSNKPRWVITYTTPSGGKRFMTRKNHP